MREWELLNKRYVELGCDCAEADVWEFISIGRACEAMAKLMRDNNNLKQLLEKKEKEGKKEKEKQEAEIRRLRKLELNFPVEKIEAVSKATDKVLEERKKVEDEWANVVKDMREVHQREVGQLQFVMGLQTKKIKELRASGGEVKSDLL